MTITTSTEDVDRLCAGPLSEIAMSQGLLVTQQDVNAIGIAAATLRALAAERDTANKQIYGLAEERERWKERAERAEQRLGDLLAVIHRDGGQFWAVHGDEAAVNKAHHAWATLITRAERAEAEAERLREALNVYASPGFWQDDMMTDPAPITVPCTAQCHHDQGEIARAALEGGDKHANEKPRQP